MICNDCTGSAFQAEANRIYLQYQGFGDPFAPDVIVVNLVTSEARAFTSTFYYQGERLKIVSQSKSLPSNVAPAIQEYHAIVAELNRRQLIPGSNISISTSTSGDLFRITPQITGGISSSSSFTMNNFEGSPVMLNSVANGCGAAGSPVSQFIPDAPYKRACDSHDVCYAQGYEKSLCDNNFLRNMLTTATELTSDVTPPIRKALIYNALAIQAVAYYTAVYVLGTSAYCGISSNGGKQICLAYNRGYPDAAYGGKFERRTENSIGGFTSSCELWSFPDGNGSRYTITRNCSYTYTP